MNVHSMTTNCAQCGQPAELRLTNYGPDRLQAIEQLKEELALEKRGTPPNPRRLVWYEATLGQIAQAELEARRTGDARPPAPMMAIELLRCACASPAADAPKVADPLIEEAVVLLRLLTPEDLVRFALDGGEAIVDMPVAFQQGILPLASKLKRFADKMPADSRDAPPAPTPAAPTDTPPLGKIEPVQVPAEQAAPTATPPVADVTEASAPAAPAVPESSAS